MEVSNLLLLGMIGFLGFTCQWIAWKTRLPAILFLLLTGILCGSVTGLLRPTELFGDLLYPLVSLAVAIILFEGSLTLKREEFHEIGSTVRNMVTFGALINGAITCVGVHWLIGLDWPLAALFGAIMVVTGPTVIIPMLHSARPNARIAKTLRWEGIIIDPLGALFAVLIFEWIVAQQQGTELLHVIGIFAETIMAGFICGAVGAYVFGLMLRHRLLPSFLQNYAAVAFVFAVFSIANSLMHESGLLAVTVLGIWLANMRGVDTRSILHFKESLTVILVSTLFIILAANVDFSALAKLGWSAVGVLLIMQFLSRPMKVFASTWGSDFSLNERLLLAWIGPRGIVAAAVSALFALRLEQQGFADAHLLVPLSFSVIIGTVVLQGSTARLFTRWLQVGEPDNNGYIIIGANPVAITVAKALQEAGIDSILCDNYWDNISAARMAGLKTYYGNAMSDHAERYLDLSGMGGMLGLSHYTERNTSAALRFRDEFDIRNIYTLASPHDLTTNEKHHASESHKGRIAFGDDVTYGKLASLIKRGGVIKETKLSEAYNFDNWREQASEREVIALFTIDSANKVQWFSADQQPEPQPSWSIFSLVLSDTEANGNGENK